MAGHTGFVPCHFSDLLPHREVRGKIAFFELVCHGRGIQGHSDNATREKDPTVNGRCFVVIGKRGEKQRMSNDTGATLRIEDDFLETAF